MSDPNGKKGMSAGGIFAICLAVGGGLVAVGFGLSSFIETVGAAKRHYPEVVMGLIIVFLGILLFFQKKKEAAPHP